jgi:hypothetical protein
MAVAARVVLDPGTNLYYTAGLVVGAALWDIIGSPAAPPRWTVAVCLGLFASRWIPMPPSGHGWLTLGFFLACCALVCAKPGGRPDRRAASRRPARPSDDVLIAGKPG